MRATPFLLSVSLALTAAACGGGPDPDAEAQAESAEASLARTLGEALRAVGRGQPEAFLAHYTPPEALRTHSVEARLRQFSRQQTQVQAALRAAQVAGPELSTDGRSARFHYEGLILVFTRLGPRWYLEVQ